MEAALIFSIAISVATGGTGAAIARAAVWMDFHFGSNSRSPSIGIGTWVQAGSPPHTHPTDWDLGCG